MTFFQTCFAQGVSWLLLADTNRFRSMGSGFRDKKDQPMSYDFLVGILILLSIVVFIWILSRFLSRQERIRRHFSPKVLFQALCTAHQLEPSQRRLLKRLARHHGLAQPARIFLEPDRFDPTSLGASFHNQQDELIDLRERLFAEMDIDDAAELVGATSELRHI